ncbi:hypothetical protein ACRJ4W_24935 [Streptomyces sp. GLT-R25]
MIRFTMMPGEDGDCLLLEYGDGGFVRRILVDGGRSGTYPLIKPTLAGLDGQVDVLVVTHVDQDHIHRGARPAGRPRPVGGVRGRVVQRLRPPPRHRGVRRPGRGEAHQRPAGTEGAVERRVRRTKCRGRPGTRVVRRRIHDGRALTRPQATGEAGARLDRGMRQTRADPRPGSRGERPGPGLRALRRRERGPAGRVGVQARHVEDERVEHRSALRVRGQAGRPHR